MNLKIDKNKPNFLTFHISVLSLLNYWPKNENEDYKWRLFKDSSLILSLMPCAIPIAADFCYEFNSIFLQKYELFV